MPLPHNLFDYCSIRKSNFIEKYLVVKRKISFVYKADILLTKLIIRGRDLLFIFIRLIRGRTVCRRNFMAGQIVSAWFQAGLMKKLLDV